MVINVSVQYNGGFLLDIILLTLRITVGNYVKYHEEVLPWQAMFPPDERFDGMLRRFRCVQISL